MILFFYGENSFAMRREVERIRTHYVKKSGGDTSLEIFDLSEKSFDDLIRSVAAQPLFATSRLIIVRGLLNNKQTADKSNQLTEAVPESTIMIVEEREVDRRSKAFKSLAKLPAKNVKEFKDLSIGQLEKWVTSEVRQQGGRIDSATASLLVERVGHDQWQLAQEINKLVNFAPEIKPKVIEQLVVANTDQTIFMLIDAIAAGELSRAFELYHRLAQDGVADQQIIAMLNWHFRNLALACANPGSMGWAKDFGISPYAAQKASAQAANFDIEEVRCAYRYLVEADYAIKSGAKISQAAMEDLIYQLTS